MLLRKCFSQNVEIKHILRDDIRLPEKEGLSRKGKKKSISEWEKK